MPEPSSVPRIVRPAPRAFLREFLARRRPVVITGVADRWPAISRWDAAYFKRTLPEVEVRVEIWDREGPGNDPADYLKSVRRRPMSLGELLDRIQASGRDSRNYYLAQYPILEAAPGLLDDVHPPEEYMRVGAFIPRALARRMRLEPALWMGPAGAVTTLHFDSTHNLFAQIAGKKKVILIPPAESDLVYYPCREFGMNLHFSPVDVEHPDLSRHPLFARATPLEVTVEPGEMLFIPATWWHYLRALEPAISLNFWWNTPATLWGPPRHLLLEWRERFARFMRGDGGR
ncbi:MAG: cupin-like domain-containing protein [Acidobacteria bacterium]|nr:MAG: cupin-like domain-containing protein [Acidobacteriota bacterium]